jgi:hypothetical protein
VTSASQRDKGLMVPPSLAQRFNFVRGRTECEQRAASARGLRRPAWTRGVQRPTQPSPDISVADAKPRLRCAGDVEDRRRR